ncbi:MAG: hypothetical protein Q4A76_05225, partial [Porphyromonadaceae bacterium]|nr:hypothetical protein [Porphyromonadaceae bacterium]
QQNKWIQDEKEGIVSLRVEYVKRKELRLEFIKNIEWEIDECNNIVKADEGKEIIIDEEANFAPGTYVELKANGLEQNTNVVWVLVQIQNEAKLQRILEGKEELDFKDINFLKDESGYFHQCQKLNKIGFSLPLIRANEDEFDKYYALVFAYEDKNKLKRLPNLNDAYKIIDMSFKVGSGRDDGVKELLTRDELRAFDLYHLNRQKSINSIEEANWFLKAILKDYKIETFFTHLRIHPQLAGKIAYIYYRFDLINKEFLMSVIENDKEIYLQDRDDKYINTILNEILPLEYKDGKNFKHFYEKLANDEYKKLNECEDFLQALTQTICEKFELPLEKIVFYNEKASEFLSFGAYTHNEIRLNQYTIKNYFEESVKTVFHECRHFYIEKYYHQNMDALGSYVFYSKRAYINEKIIFDGFNKFCNANENYFVGCNIGNIQNAYEFQPNERDPRYVETFIAKNLK